MRKNLSVPYHEKDEAKKGGARWDPLERTWYIDRPDRISKDLAPEDKAYFAKWLKDVPEHKIVDFKPTKWCPAYKK